MTAVVTTKDGTAHAFAESLTIEVSMTTLHVLLHALTDSRSRIG